MTAISYALRHWMWRLASAVSGGLTVTGKWRGSGGCIVVANHSSHADTAVSYTHLTLPTNREV